MLSSAQRETLAKDILSRKLSETDIRDLRFKAQTDLYFLCTDILGKNLTERTHRRVCNAFVQKDPRKHMGDLDPIKERLILYPRTSYKSTVDGVDCVQWHLCYPNIRLVKLTGLEDLSRAFVEEMTNYFVDDQEDYCLLHALFPEYVIKGKDKRDGYFISPARTKYWKEPTFFAQSIESNTSGWHVDVMKCDDIITDENSENPVRLKRITKKYNMIRKLVMTYGYRDTIGTRYELDDTYGVILQRAGIDKLYGEIVSNGLKYLSVPAWWLKDTDYQTPSLDVVPDREQVEILFPEGISYETLCKELNDDKGTFASQYLNDPVGASDTTFKREDLMAATIPYTAIPKMVRRFIVWDLSYQKATGTKAKVSRRDWTVGAVCEVDTDNRIYVVDIIRGRYKPHELPYIIVKAIKDWQPERVGIEDMLGAQWLTPDLNRIANNMLVDLKIEWFEISNKNNSTVDRVKNLEVLLTEKRLFFAANIAQLDALYKEFERFTGYQTSHDDIPVAISYIQKFVTHDTADMVQDRRKKYMDMVAKDQYDRVYCQGAYALPNPYEIIQRERFDPYTGLPC